MPLVSLNNITIAFRGPPLLDDVSTVIEPGQKIGLLGRNGAGKSTLLKMLGGIVPPDSGEIVVTPGSRISTLSQDVPTDLSGSTAEIVQQGLVGLINPGTGDPMEEWETELQADQTLSRMDLDPEARFEKLSSGMKRRVLLARAIATEPDLLLLDEPTNHLDIEAIDWLENFLLTRFNAALMFVTHDRMFLRRLANRILEIDRGRMFDWTCDYETFLERKQQQIEAEEKQNALFDRKLAEEEVWIRKGIKARRTRNEGRVRALKAMREQRSERREQVGTSKLRIDEAQKSGRLTLGLKEVSFAYGDHVILDDFSTTVMRGDKVGIIGRNGAGKSTLLKVMLGQLEPQDGTVKLGTNLEIAYFDQLRDQLDLEATVLDNVGGGSDHLLIGGVKKHVLGYMQDFLFEPARARMKVKFLSGGERNRILLARLFSKPANVIVLDEPTNDLDAETLELLEERLVEFQGTVLVVSHDRAFLNNVVTSTIVFEPGGVREYDGGYDDWLRQRAMSTRTETPVAPTSNGKTKPAAAKKPATSAVRKLSYKEQRELEALPEKIADVEGKIAAMHQTMGAANFYQKPGDEIAAAQAKLRTLDDELAALWKRWEELES